LLHEDTDPKRDARQPSYSISRDSAERSVTDSLFRAVFISKAYQCWGACDSQQAVEDSKQAAENCSFCNYIAL